MYAKWQDDKFGVGIELFDNQHKTLLGMINKLHDGMKEGKSKEAMGSVLDELMLYTVRHFSDEEVLMKKHGFPGYEKHFHEHQELLAQVREFKSDYDAEIKMMTVEVMGFLVNWLITHIGQSDREYVPFLKEKGVT